MSRELYDNGHGPITPSTVGWGVVVLLAFIGGFQVLQWLTVDVLGMS